MTALTTGAAEGRATFITLTHPFLVLVVHFEDIVAVELYARQASGVLDDLVVVLHFAILFEQVIAGIFAEPGYDEGLADRLATLEFWTRNLVGGIVVDVRFNHMHYTLVAELVSAFQSNHLL